MVSAHYWCGRLLHREFLSPLRPSLLSVEFPPSFSRDQLIQCTAGWWKRARHHGANVSSEVGRVRKHEQELGTHHRWSGSHEQSSDDGADPPSSSSSSSRFRKSNFPWPPPSQQYQRRLQ
ncbi:hypothetical protein MUK42_20007 [Musa troglodytarum]|uniref:Uncharacterized protein n=1 Tax=Musa troglodytarum TaxID=320322 RepID=A0A9E7JH24_9LILI|nr:hypothetical protein MUK42_20007 [Musa troglodytarum]